MLNDFYHPSDYEAPSSLEITKLNDVWLGQSWSSPPITCEQGSRSGQSGPGQVGKSGSSEQNMRTMSDLVFVKVDKIRWRGNPVGSY